MAGALPPTEAGAAQFRQWEPKRGEVVGRVFEGGGVAVRAYDRSPNRRGAHEEPAAAAARVQHPAAGSCASKVCQKEACWLKEGADAV